LIDSKVALVVTHGEAAIEAVKQVNPNIPIVVGVTGDLIVTGHALASLGREEMLRASWIRAPS